MVTMAEFRSLLEYIDKNHSWRKNMGKKVKYVDSTIDMRNGKIFIITLRSLGYDKEFWIINENKDKNLVDWIKEWLDE